MPVWLVAVATVFAGAFCQGLTGFGFGLIAVPLLSLVWEVKAVVPAAALLGLATIVPLLVQVRSEVRFKPVLTLLLGTVAGTPIGVAVLVAMDAAVLKIWVAVVVVVLSVLFALSPRLRVRSHTLGASLVVGAVSGLLRGSTSMGGPPIALYLLGLPGGVESFRSAILAYHFWAGIMVIAGFAAAGKVTLEVLTTSALSLPPLFLGLWLGATLRYRVRPSAFQFIVLAVLVLTSIAAIASVLVG